MTIDNIFSKDILRVNLNTSLIPELGQEDISVNITPTESSLIDPLTQELSLIEPEIVFENENSIDNNSALNNDPSINNFVVSNIDPFIAANAEEFQVNQIDVNDTSFAPPQSELQFQGGFGDYDGGDDVTLELKDTDGNVIETFKLTGEGEATLYRDEEYQYVFFSGVDETTKVDIDSTSNIKFGNYVGDSLKIETSGSIEGGDIVLNEPDETGLVLKSGASGNRQIVDFTPVLLGRTQSFNQYSIAHDINNLGQVVGVDIYTNDAQAFLYDNGEKISLGFLPGDSQSVAHSINDKGQIVGISYHDSGRKRLFLYENGEMSELDINSINYNPIISNSGKIFGSFLETNSDNNYYIIRSPEVTLFWLSDDDSGLGFHDVNDFDQTAGFSHTTNTDNRSVYRAFSINQLGQGSVLGGDKSVAHGINNQAQAVGVVNGSAVLFEQGQVSRIDTSELAPLANITSTAAYDINNLGQIVGSRTIRIGSFAQSQSRGFFYDNGRFVDLRGFQQPKKINDQGQIIVNELIGRVGSFLLNPVYAESNSKIKIGNISTFGDSVLLQGDEITLTGQAITTAGGEIKIDGATTTERNLTIDNSVIEDEVITDGGDITFTGTLDNSGTNNLRLQAGTGNILFGDVVGGEATFNNIIVFGANTVTAEADITSNGRIKINATEDITAKNITSETGNVKLISEEKSITTEDITTKNPEGKNIVIEAIEGIDVANLDTGELGVVRITSGEIVENDTETLEDDTVIVGDISTKSITGKAVRAVGTGSFTATGDITAHDGRITVAVTNDVNTKSINSLVKSINLISTEGAVTVDGDLNSEKGGVAIHAANDINTQKIRSFDGAVALSSYNGEITVEDDINTVRGGVTIAAKEGVEIARITTGIGEVNIGSGGDIIANGNISTNVGYVNLKAGGRLDVQSVTTNDGYVSLGADSNVEIQSLTTNSGAINLISATGSVAVAGSIDTAGSYVAIEAALEIIASAIEANGGGVDLIANSDFGGNATLIASGGISDVGTDVIDSLGEIILEQQEFVSEVVNDLIYHYRGVGEFILGVLYQTTANNLEDAFNIGQFFLPLKLSERDKRNWTQIIESQSTAFQLGRELANAASIVQGIIEIFTGGAAVISGSSLCLAGAGATLGASCFAAAPAIAGGAALSAHGLSLIKNGLENNTDANLIDDLLAPQKMASTGGANGADGLAEKIGTSPDRVKNALEVLGTKKVEQLEGRLNFTETRFQRDASGQLVETKQEVKLLNRVLDKSKELIFNVSKAFDFVDNKAKGINDIDGIDDIRATIKQNRDRQNKPQLINDTELNTAFIENNNFIEQYQGRASGAFANRFGKANSSELNNIQARGEINTAKDILDGNTLLGNDVRLRGLPERTNTQKNPEYFATMPNGDTRLVEVKTLKDTFNQRKLKINLQDATDQIAGYPTKNVSNKGYVRLDFRNTDPISQKPNWWLGKVTKFLVDPKRKKEKVVTPGIEVVEFVEILYKNPQNQVQQIYMRINNGVVGII
ncbi:MAG: hypothetical protein AAF383_01275 [Cyanobacteria bacterium P01_A01_bin.83]